jgi:hypothetical protein
MSWKKFQDPYPTTHFDKKGIDKNVIFVPNCIRFRPPIELFMVHLLVAKWTTTDEYFLCQEQGKFKKNKTIQLQGLGHFKNGY